MLWIINILDFRIVNLCESDSTENHISVQNKVRTLFYVVISSGSVVTIAGMCVFWIFAMKYWSVALKFDLVVQEKDIDSEKTLVNTLLAGGLVSITVSDIMVTAA